MKTITLHKYCKIINQQVRITPPHAANGYAWAKESGIRSLNTAINKSNAKGGAHGS